MKAKEYLQRLKRLNTLIDQKMKEYNDLGVMSTSIGSIEIKERVQSSPSLDAPFARIIDRMIDLQGEINAEIDRYVDEKHKIINEIHALQCPDEMNVLYKRYIEGKSFEQIAVDMNYSIRNIYFIHGRALKNFADLHLDT